MIIELEKNFEITKQVLNKYDCLYANIEKNKFYKNFERYLINILEEVYETETALPEDYLGEVCDIVNYTLTSIQIVEDTLKNYVPLTDIKQIEFKKENVECSNLYTKIIKIRRYFPERKWHKPHDSKYTFEEKLQMTLKTLLEVLNMALNLFPFPNTIIKQSLEKQTIILNL